MDSSNFLPIQSQTLSLEKLRLRARSVVTKTMLLSADLDVYQDHIFDQLVYNLEATVLAEKLVDKTQVLRYEETFTQPSNWYQHMKQDHFPKWFVRRWHVKLKSETREGYRNVNFKQYASFPASPIRTPDKYRGPTIVLHEQMNLGEWKNEA